MGCSCLTLRDPCNNQRPVCDIACLHVASDLYHGFLSYTVKQSHLSRSIVYPFNSESSDINITCTPVIGRKHELLQSLSQSYPSLDSFINLCQIFAQKCHKENIVLMLFRKDNK